MNNQDIITNEYEENIIPETSVQHVPIQEDLQEVVMQNDTTDLRTNIIVDEHIVISDVTTGNEGSNAPIEQTPYVPSQYTIGTITGLPAELNSLKSLKDTVYAKNQNYANYYLWQDENPLPSNRDGLFVTLNTDGTISICNNNNTILGVTVSNAAFVGGQDDDVRNASYGLVITSGVVSIRCESNVVVGDYIISNNFGCAQTSAYGYKVMSISIIGGVRYATIALDISANDLNNLGTDVHDLTTRIDNAETNILSAINLANDAHNLSIETSTNITLMATNALSHAENTTQVINDINTRLSNTESDVALARVAAETAANMATNLRNQTIATTNQALTDVQSAVALIETVRNETTDIANNALLEAQQAVTDALSALGDSQDALNAATGAISDAQEAKAMAEDSVKTVEVQYAIHTSDIEPPLLGWQLTSPAREYGKYIWQRTLTIYMDDSEHLSDATCISGADGKSIDIEIVSSNGNIFKNGNISTTLSCHVLENGIDITDNINAAYFHWEKINNDGTHDTAWETSYAGGTKEITITPTDIYVRATFLCSVDGYPQINN